MPIRLDHQDFLRSMSISKDDYEAANIDWSELNDIYDDYESYKSDLEDPAEAVVNVLFKSDKVHSIRYRIKDSEHLIEKIIRKRAENSSRDINLDNYKNEITDLIGIRILHLHKKDWQDINKFIQEKFLGKINEGPDAYIRNGDKKDIYNSDAKNIYVHEAGYRSVHYLIETSPAAETYNVEIQVRTLFEEGWSEVDHRIRYPNKKDSPLLNAYLGVFNRVSGLADEMSDYIHYLNKGLTRLNEKLEEKEAMISKLKMRIAMSNLTITEKSQITEDIDFIDMLISGSQIPSEDPIEFTSALGYPLKSSLDFLFSDPNFASSDEEE